MKKMMLSGQWEFQTDPDGTGFEKGWASGDKSLSRHIQVPGAWQAQGIGKPEAHLRHHYVGWGWYRRKVNIPGAWRRGRVWLEIGGASVKTRAYVNGREVGSHYGFSTSFRFDVTDAVHAGRNEIVLAVSNLPNSGKILPPGQHHHDDPTGCFNYMARWGGIYRDVFLEATPFTWVEDCYVIPHPKEARIEVRVEVRGDKAGKRIQIEVAGRAKDISCTGKTVDVLDLSLPRARLWSPEEPALHDCHVRLLDAKGKRIHARRVRFGLRDISVEGNRIMLNGRPYYINGYGDDNIEVLTGFPPCDKEIYRQRLLLMKKCGFNAARHHSWVPTEEYFQAADEVGMLIQAELPVVYPRFFMPNMDFLQDELVSILKTHRNHPSLFALSMGNEFERLWYYRHVSSSIDFGRAIERFYGLAKELFSTGFVVATSGEIFFPTDIHIVHFPQSNISQRPMLIHELGGYGCSLPDIRARKLFTGVVQPSWLDQKEAWLAKSGWSHIYPEVVTNSQRLLHSRRKMDMEALRLNQVYSGYYWWLLTDGTSGVEGDAWQLGILDIFLRPKSFQPEESSRFNNRTVLLCTYGGCSMPWDLCRMAGHSTLWDDWGGRTELILSHYGHEEIKDGQARWRVTKSSDVELARGEINGINQAQGSNRLLRQIDIGQYGVNKVEEVELSVVLKWSYGESRNAWSFWLFPRPAGPLSDPGRVRSHPDLEEQSVHEIYPPLAKKGLDAGTRVIICDGKALAGNTFDRRISGFLASGGRLVFLANNADLPRQIDRTFRQDWGLGYGSFIQDHPALALFPRKKYCDQSYAGFFEGKSALLLEDLPRQFVPIVGGVTQRPENVSETRSKELAKFGMVMEGKMGKGKIIMTTWNTGDIQRPESRYLVESLVAYALSREFQPKFDLAPLFRKPGRRN